MTTTFKNNYHLRKVAESSSKPCAFCYKPTTSVLITSDGSSDFFYTCDVHLLDTSFATPIHSQAYLDALAKKETLDKEIKHLKQRWDEKNRYSGWEKIVSYTKWSSSSSSKDKADGKDEEEEDHNDKGKTQDEKEKADRKKLKELHTESTDIESVLTKQPRVYQLNKDIFKIRLDKKKPKPQIDTTGVKDLSLFPSVPTNRPS